VRASESGSEDEKWDAHPKAQTHVLRSDELETQAPDELASLSPVSSDDEEAFDPGECLFCDLESPSTDENLRHMSDTHSFSIPSKDRLIDTSCFLQYLHILVSMFHECLFCHKERNSKAGVQDHMRGKGHCKLDLEHEESELWEFYDSNSEGEEVEEAADEAREKIVQLEDSLRLPSGKILGHRSQPRSSQRHFLKRPHPTSPQQLLLTEGGDEAEVPVAPTATKDQRLVLRKGAEMSLAGVSELQQRALMVVEKKMEGLRARAKNEYQAGVERGGNKQKTFRVKHIGKKRGGLEKRNG
jgi:pre-60S factor REI1